MSHRYLDMADLAWAMLTNRPIKNEGESAREDATAASPMQAPVARIIDCPLCENGISDTTNLPCTYCAGKTYVVTDGETRE
jgi:hypothetical protein